MKLRAVLKLVPVVFFFKVSKSNTIYKSTIPYPTAMLRCSDAFCDPIVFCENLTKLHIKKCCVRNMQSDSFLEKKKGHK